MTDPVHRLHLSLSFNELLTRLGLDPRQVHITRTWCEEGGVDYLHLLIEPGHVGPAWVEETGRYYEQIGDGPQKLTSPQPMEPDYCENRACCLERDHEGDCDERAAL